MQYITAEELLEEFGSSNQPRCIDVRQKEELQYGVLPNSIHVPMQEIPSRIEELKKFVENFQGKIIVYCRVGGRSESVIRYLEKMGFAELWNLTGGTNAYSLVDPKVLEY